MSFNIYAVTAFGALSLIGGAASAQTMSTTSTGFETGYGRTRGQEEQAVNVSTRDANGNRVLLDGVIVTGSDNSVYSQSKTYGAGDSYSGAGALGGATAIGNNLSVTVSGNYNTVIVNSTQINNGNITATNGTKTATAGTETDITGNLNGF
ncbi:holdfast anchoring protein HfaA [Asticcacaulis sp. BYS171W]|uniref:Holdfast anchoring protein HfaA n=1 Tax=Asticcacaulis aquaticus TaxID=2984212 RepID=A0ABT5HYU7_9CAUL|nr:holdfast anchoring protein HfaA [Asticcacaulis aquaticus]MDC7685244.1 holdfast anchoring protein HfaA [Asticcacaulis aquaticus]